MKIPAFIKQLARICDKSSSRYALGGIECKSDGNIAKITATDGRILASVHWQDATGVEMSVIAAAKDLSNGPAAAYREGVAYDGECVRIGNKEETSDVAVIDGRFPNCEQVFSIHDDPTGYRAVTLDASLLRKLCDLSEAMNDNASTKGITLFVKDATSCVFGSVTGENGEIGRMAIMPRTDGDAAIPEFPARPGAESVDAEPEKRSQKRPSRGRKPVRLPAPPPETLDDDAVADAVCREPEPCGSEVGLVDCEPL
jgi:hypothetical protein